MEWVHGRADGVDGGAIDGLIAWAGWAGVGWSGADRWW